MAYPIIQVQAAQRDRRVALSESHPDHPGGEAWVVGDDRVHQVALTPAVARRLASGDLLQVAAEPKQVEPGEPGSPEHAEQPEPKPTTRRKR